MTPAPPAGARPPLKAMFVLASLEMGGVQKFTVDLLTHIDRRRVQPVVVLSHRRGDLVDLVPADCPVHDLGRHGRFDFLTLVFRLARVIRRERPDVIFASQFHANLLAVLARRISGVRVPVIISEHLSVRNYELGPGWVRALMRWSYSQADCAVGPSQGIARELTANWRVEAGRVRVLHYPLDLSRIHALSREPVDADIDPTVPCIVSVGRLTRQKGMPALLRAFATLRRELPATLVIVGDGEDRQALQTLASTLGVAPHVTWVGLDANPYRWMRRGTVFALASLFEGFPIVVMEALALGMPIVATDCPHGPAEMFRGGQDGILVPVGDDDALAAGLKRVLCDAPLRLRLVDAARQRAKDFGLDQIVPQFEALFEHAAHAA